MDEKLTYAGAVIVAGGLGKRMGRPKQLLPLAGKPVLVRSVEAFKKIPFVKQIVVVTSAENREVLKKYFSDLIFAQPGQTRLASVMSGVNALDPKIQAIAVHDGARPLVNPLAAQKCLLRGFWEEAAVLAVLAGNDLLCSSEYRVQYPAVLEAVKSGRISMTQLDASVMRILQWKRELGLIF